MIEGKHVLAVVPARGGSKGIPLKNLHPVCGVPLIALVGKVVAEVPSIDRAVVSTDHPAIKEAAIAAGLDAPFSRPQEISGDLIGDWDVLTHALSATENIDGIEYDIVVMLQPTSPLRRPAHVVSAIEMLVRENLDAVWTVSETDSKSHPLKQLTVDGGRLDYYDDRGGDIIARQQLELVYHRNGAAYAITRGCLIDHGSIKGAATGAVIIDEPMVSIDTLWDVKLVEDILSGQDDNFA